MCSGLPQLAISPGGSSADGGRLCSPGTKWPNCPQSCPLARRGLWGSGRLGCSLSCVGGAPGVPISLGLEVTPSLLGWPPWLTPACCPLMSSLSLYPAVFGAVSCSAQDYEQSAILKQARAGSPPTAFCGAGRWRFWLLGQLWSLCRTEGCYFPPFG
jgi:hypothetical protein